MYTIGNRMSLGDAFLNRQIFLSRASVSTFFVLQHLRYGKHVQSVAMWLGSLAFCCAVCRVALAHSLESPVFVCSGGVETINPLHIRINICLHSLF
jgi:hypothetical protein